jgi:DNA helicase-2/ATP-dependent DNA helicase PcrA
MSFADKYPKPKSFLSFAEQMRADDAKRNKDQKKRKGVHLLTMHSSKGLEYDHVIIAGACTRLMPFYKAHSDKEGLEEERRLAYVGVTRPKKKLYVSTISGHFGRFKVKPTQYLEEMGIFGAN